MFSWATTTFALLLVAGSVVLVLINRRTWRTAQGEADVHERDFARRQFRRRVQASAMIGLAGIAMFIVQFIGWPLLALLGWAGIVLLVLWIVLLALADYAVTWGHYGRVRRDHLATEVRLQAELRREQQRQRPDRNGAEDHA